MTQFEEIKQALIELGWQMEEGRGDHVKFFLPGNRRPVTISRSISGRAYQNKIANIRKIDPRFSLGKQKKKKREDADNGITAETSEPIAKYDYIQVGKMVRYTMPERKDFSKLAIADSAMNIPYVVASIGSGMQVCSEDDTVTIKYEDHSIDVSPKDLDAWEVRKCTSCGMKFPVNCFHDEPNMCDSCAKEARKKAEAMIKASLATQPRKLTMEQDDFTLVPAFTVPFEPDERSIFQMKNISEMFSYSREMERDLNSLCKKLPKDAAEDIKRKKEDVAAFRMMFDTEGIETVTLAKIMTAMKIYIGLIYKEGLMMPHWTEPKEDFVFDYSYSVRTISGINEYIVNVRDKDCLYIALTEIGMLHYLLRKFYKDNFVVRVVCDAESCDQYIAPPVDVEDTIRLLNEKYPEDELKGKTEYLERYGGLCAEDIDELIGEKFKDELDNESISLTIIPVAVTSDNKIDILAYDSQPQLYVLAVIHEKEPTAQEKILNKLKDVAPGFLEDAKKITKGHNVIVGVIAGGFFNAINCDRYAITEIKYDMASFTAVYDSLATIMDEICDKVRKHNVNAASLITKAISAWENLAADKTVQKDNNEKQTSTIMENSLDNTNPSSENKVLADITTRELLKELRDRGVQFENLTIPVVTRMTVSLDQI